MLYHPRDTLYVLA